MHYSTIYTLILLILSLYTLYIICRFISFDDPEHISATCRLHIAKDHKNNDEKVALKFMTDYHQYLREIEIRTDMHLSSEYVINLLGKWCLLFMCMYTIYTYAQYPIIHMYTSYLCTHMFYGILYLRIYAYIHVYTLTKYLTISNYIIFCTFMYRAF